MAEMGYLYNLMSRQNDAIEMFEKSLEAHNYQTNESFDDEYLEISQQLASLYETTGNRVAAARMITKDREFIRSAHNLTPTPQMVNYVVSGYYRAVKNNDFNSAFLYLSQRHGISSAECSHLPENLITFFTLRESQYARHSLILYTKSRQASKRLKKV